jgi:hypothetical protein
MVGLGRDAECISAVPGRNWNPRMECSPLDDGGTSCRAARVLVLSRSSLPWFQNMASERTQNSTIHRIFLWEEFLGLLGILTKLFLRFEDRYILPGPLEKVDEINMFLQDSLGREMKNQMVHATGHSPHGIPYECLELGLFSGHDIACTNC